MRAAPLAIVGALAVSLAGATLAAQQSDTGKRRPKQTHDKGVDDAVPQEQVDNSRIGERLVNGIAVVARPDGTLEAQLDESFHDAIVAVTLADGRTTYTCLHGLSAADGLVAVHAPVDEAPAPPAPRLEEK
jgi:hypothetical protein